MRQCDPGEVTSINKEVAEPRVGGMEAGPMQMSLQDLEFHSAGSQKLRKVSGDGVAGRRAFPHLYIRNEPGYR